MGAAAVFLPRRRSFAKAIHRVGFVDEDVAAAAVVDERLRRRSVARNHDDAVGRIKSEAEGIYHVLVLGGECRDCDVLVIEDDAWRNLMRIHFATDRSALIDTVGADVDVHLPGFEDMLGHGLDPLWTVDCEWL